MKPQTFSRFTTAIQLADEGQQESWNEIFRVGNWSESYKQFEATEQHLADMVKNFQANVCRYAQGEVPVNYGHDMGGKAAGWISGLKLEDGRLLAQIRWTPAAKQQIQDEEWKYFSAEIWWEYEDQETKKKTNNVLSGLALTNIPFVSDMAAAKLDKGNLSAGDPESNISLSHPKMDKFKELLAGLAAKDKVSAAELAKLQGAFLMLSEDEQSEVKEETEAVEAKVEEEKPKTDGEAETKLSAFRSDLDATKAELSKAHSKIDSLTDELRKRDETARLEQLHKEGKRLPKSQKDDLALLLSLPQKQADAVFASWESQPAVVSFEELGSGDDGDPETAKEALLSTKIAELQKANPKLTHASALKRAVAENPELAPKL